MPAAWQPPSVHPDAQLVEAAITLARSSGVTVYDSQPAKGAPLPSRPYAVAYGGLGTPARLTMAPVSNRVDTRLQFTVVGDSAAQVRWALGQLRAALLDQRVSTLSRRSFPLTISDSQDVRPDDDVKSAPVFYAADVYRLAAVHA